MLGVPGDRLDVRRSDLLHPLDEGVVLVERDDLANAWGERERKRSGPRSDVERTLVAAKRQQALEQGGELVRARRLQLHPAVNPVHGRSWWSASAGCRCRTRARR